ncbi:FAD-dependent oxidoreductase [Pendulispora albinea]|uniref:FAD-dependent oxidoreductase n=1 Tax=Pendulispora albinea TaxID=2741071 RepID=A0ABZ2LMK9_9BACT
MGSSNVVVVGGGLAGLCAAVRAASAGASVTLLERSHQLGGRAASQTEGEHTFNQGPHALYLGGAAARELDELGIAWEGSRAKSPYFFVERDGAFQPLPSGVLALLTSSVLGFGGKMQFASAFGKLTSNQGFESMPLSEWLARVTDPRARALLAALFRVTTYSADHDKLSAAAAMRQLHMGLDRGVAYLDGGWQSLVDRLTLRALDAGVAIHTRTSPVCIAPEGPRLCVHVPDVGPLLADSVVLAAGPRTCAALVPESASLANAAAQAVPVRAACLDVALNQLPNARHHFTLGVDSPDYLSVHSAFARLAPEGGAVVHVARYLVGDAHDPAQVRAELEALLDRSQPGWRPHAVYTRFLPKMTVAHALPLASEGGARMPVAVPDVPRLFVAGDWVGDEGMLLDAALASARRAAELALRSIALRDVA